MSFTGEEETGGGGATTLTNQDSLHRPRCHGDAVLSLTGRWRRSQQTTPDGGGLHGAHLMEEDSTDHTVTPSVHH
ncbi:unnamed protein product [Arctogadus glacialis]